MRDDELEELLRASNPATTPADAPLTLRQRSTMERIIAEKAAPRRSRGPVALLIGAPIAALFAIFVVVVGVLQPFAASPATAFGPTPLEYQPTSQTTEEVVQVAQRQLQSGSDAAAPIRAATSTAWNLAVAEDGSGQQTVAISPSVSELTWTEDLAGTLVVRAGEPYFADGSGGTVPGDEAAPAGTILDDREFAPGEFPAQVPELATLSPAATADLLGLLAPDRSRPGDAFLGMHALLDEWTLTDQQHSALVGELLQYDNITVLGTTTDRLDRDVVGLAGPSSRPGQRTTLLVSASSGRIVGVETVVVEDDELLAVPAGTVISYTLWKDHE
jgi:hypothetical protein